MGPDQLALIWGQLSAQLGALESLESGRITEHGEYHSAYLPASFENHPLRSPALLDESSFLEVDLTVGAEPWLLPAVLTVPRGDGPFRDLAWGLATPEEYVSGASYVAEEVMEDLVQWILQKGG